MSYPYIMQGNNITVVIDNKPFSINQNHIEFARMKEAIRDGDWDMVKDIIDPKKVIINYSQNNVSIQGDTLYWKGEVFHNALSRRMIQMYRDGFNIQPMILFIENLMMNPSYRSVNELYGFLENNNLPITPDGHFLAYKKVRDDYTDIFTGTMSNALGDVVQMERNKVDDNKDVTCSYGLHFCSKDYLPHFGVGEANKVMIVKINPRDVVSIPVDYNNAKGRACRYEVIGEIGVDNTETAFTKPVQVNANNTIAEIKQVDFASKAIVEKQVKTSNRPLSMTKNAIRKREKRAAIRALQGNYR